MLRLRLYKAKSTFGEKKKSLKDMLARAKILFRGDNAMRRDHKSHKGSPLVLCIFFYSIRKDPPID